MRKLLIIIILAVAIVGQKPPDPVPPVAFIETCAEGVYPSAGLSEAAEAMREKGCSHVEFDYLSDGFWLGRGERIVIKY